MASSIFQNSSQPTPQQGQSSNMNMLQQFAQFKQSMRGQDPNAVLNNLVASGRYTQEQVNQATQMAKQFSWLLK